jgi:ATP synthase protein I
MNPFKGPSKGKQDKSLTQVGIYMTIPVLLAAGPLVGYLIGSWADEYFGTEPYLLIVGLLLGFGAAAREIINLIKRAQALEDDGDRDSNSDGT